MKLSPDLQTIAAGLRGLAVFRPLLKKPVPQKLLALLQAAEQGAPAALVAEYYADFAAALYNAEADLGKQLRDLVFASENAAVRRRATGRPLPLPMQQSLSRELALFTAISRTEPGRFAALAAEAGGEPAAFLNTAFDFEQLYTQRLNQAPTRGWGIFTEGHMFTLGEDGEFRLVQNPDPQRLSELIGYEEERQQVVVNTRALLSGLPAANILLYGDAGTGKSSTVKALANEFFEDGLRLVELRKDQLGEIPALMDRLAENPLKFILFIDDLSLPAEGGEFTELKAVLEGNVSARPCNLVVYATSNRRHLISERFSDRRGGEVHLTDTLEEQSSLAARFGLTVTFLRPPLDLYNEIVTKMAQDYGLRMPLEQILEKAEAHAIRHGGRSPRAAKQFVEYTLALEKQAEAGGGKA